jgi:hypothetical protein
MKRINEFKGYCTSVTFCEASESFVQSQETHPFLKARQAKVKESSAVEDRQPPTQYSKAQFSMVPNTERAGQTYLEAPSRLTSAPQVQSERQQSKTRANTNSKIHLKKAIP